MMDQVDQDNNGNIDFQEFCAFITLLMSGALPMPGRC